MRIECDFDSHRSIRFANRFESSSGVDTPLYTESSMLSYAAFASTVCQFLCCCRKVSSLIAEAKVTDIYSHNGA